MVHSEVAEGGAGGVVAAAAADTVWTRVVWPTMLLTEALRRLATPLALAAQTGADQPGDPSARYEAVAVPVQSRQLFS